MRVIWIVFSKEFQDIVRNRRRFIWMLISSFIIFPAIFVGPYALILGRRAEQTVNELVVPVQGLDNAPALVTYLAKEKDIQTVPAEDVEALVLNKEYSVGLIIPDDYQAQIAAGHSVPLVLVADLRNSLDYTGVRLAEALKDYGTSLVTERLKEQGLAADFVEPLTVEEHNVATTTETRGSQLGLLIPGLIISLGLGAGMPVAVASIAGEKKNLTLEPVLFTTVNRFQLVFAKLLAVLGSILFNLISMFLMFGISAVGLAFILYRASNGNLSAVRDSLSGTFGISPTTTAPPTTDGYSLDPLAILLFTLAPVLILLFGALLELIVSTWARNDEEAYTYLAPLNFLGIIVVFAALFMNEFVPQLWHYSLPVFGAIFSMRDLLSNKIDPASLAVMFVTSSLYVLLMLGLAVWMFQREEIVFRT
jgi:sodium transport system permease protein